MQRLEVSVAVRPIYGSLGFKRLISLKRKTLKPEKQSLVSLTFRMCGLLCSRYRIKISLIQ